MINNFAAYATMSTFKEGDFFFFPEALGMLDCLLDIKHF